MEKTSLKYIFTLLHHHAIIYYVTAAATAIKNLDWGTQIGPARGTTTTGRWSRHVSRIWRDLGWDPIWGPN